MRRRDRVPLPRRLTGASGAVSGAALAVAALASALAAAVAAALPAAGDAAEPAGPPRAGLVVPGVSLGGIRIGTDAARARALLGPRAARCRSCAHETWYATYRPNQPQGIGIEIRDGRVSAAFTLWSPRGWHTARAIRTGLPEESVRGAHGDLERLLCDGYDVLVLPGTAASTGFMVVGGRVWGFILAIPASPLCR